MVDLTSNSIDHEQSGIRPCIVLQNDYLNQTSDNVVIVPLTSKRKKQQFFHYVLYKNDYPFFNKEENIVLSECITCISKSRLERKLGTISTKDLNEILKTKEYVFILYAN